MNNSTDSMTNKERALRIINDIVNHPSTAPANIVLDHLDALAAEKDARITEVQQEREDARGAIMTAREIGVNNTERAMRQVIELSSELEVANARLAELEPDKERLDLLEKSHARIGILTTFGKWEEPSMNWIYGNDHEKSLRAAIDSLHQKPAEEKEEI